MIDIEGKYGIVGNCPAMVQVFRTIDKVAPTNSKVLIYGETGTGKELVANAVHKYSPRSEAPLIAVNCACIPESLIESELFGYEKGAFTGADKSRPGYVKLLRGGHYLWMK